jgi:hypothetical protein
MSKSAPEPEPAPSPEKRVGTVVTFPSTAVGEPAPAPAKKRRASSKSRPPSGPRKRTPRKKSGGSLAERIRHRLEGVWEWIEAGGAHVPGVQTTLFFWKRMGIKGVLAVLIIAGYPLGEYSLLSYAANSTLPRLAGDFGVSFEADDWSYHPFTLKTVARNVKIRPRRDTRSEAIFTASEVEFQGSVGSTLAGIWDLVRWRGFHTFNEITVKHGVLHLERSTTGHLNWADYADAVPQERYEEFLAGLYQVRTIALEDLKVNYVEHVQGNSGGGIIQTVQANVFVDAIRGTIIDIGEPEPGNPMPTKIRLSGRSADGTVDLNGRFALGQADAGTHALPDARLQKASQQTAPIAIGTSYDVTLALNNIGAAAFARTMPPTRIMATSGTLSGKVALRNAEPPCIAEAAMHEVRFAPNPQLVPVRAEYEELQRLLRNRVVSKPYKACEALTPEHERTLPTPPNQPLDPTRRARTVNAAAFVAAFNEQANADAPPAVRAAIANDSRSLAGAVVTAGFTDVSTELTNQITGSINNKIRRLGIEIKPANSKPGGAADNPVAKGVKGIGKGIRRLFGGGDDKKADKKKPVPKKPGT